MTATPRLNRRRGDVLVPLARCEPLPPLWLWSEAMETFAIHDRILSRPSGIFGVQNGDAIDDTLLAARCRAGLFDIPMPPQAPRPRLILPGHGFSPDFFQDGSWRFASRRLREVLHQPADVVEFTPVELLEGGEDARARDYALMRVRAIQPAMDLNLSECDVQEHVSGFTGERTARAGFVRRIVLPEDLRPRTDLFRIEESPTTILATDALVLRLLAANLTGIEFRDPGARDWGMHYMRLRTPTGVRLSPICFRGWPPPPGVHVPVLGWSPGDPPPLPSISPAL